MTNERCFVFLFRQSELFGQSLFKITCPEDHPELRKVLAPDNVEELGE